MIYLTITIPILISLVLLIFYTRNIKWWELGSLILGSFLMILLFNSIFISYREYVSEYWGEYITSIHHSEHWNEWISQTCENCTTDSKGNTSCTSYDCSYCEDHPEYWEMTDNEGNTYSISKSYYDYISNKFGTPQVFRADHHPAYTIDGNSYLCYFGGERKRAEIVSTHHMYKNKVRVSNSLYKYTKPDSSIIKKYGLYPYPKMDKNYQQSLLGYKGDSFNYNDECFQQINGILGHQCQIRAIVCIYYNKPIDAAFQQRALWQGGNKNEFIINIGIDGNNKVSWCKCFSWCDEPILNNEVESFVARNGYLNLSKTSDFVFEKAKSDWHRKHFRDFDYLVVEPNGSQLIALIIILLITNIGAAITMIYYGSEEIKKRKFN